MMIVLSLNRQLPTGYRMEPRTHIGKLYEIDIAAFEGDKPTVDTSSGGTALATFPKPTLIQKTDEPLYDEYEVRVLNERGKLVAAIELVSPANKDRPESRAAFATKCANLWNNQVCVSIVDLVVQMKFNLYTDMLDRIGHEDPAFTGDSVPHYAVTLRARNGLPKRGWRLESWAYPLTVGQPLPQLPIWLSDREAMLLDLESTYEDTCQALRLGV